MDKIKSLFTFTNSLITLLIAIITVGGGVINNKFEAQDKLVKANHEAQTNLIKSEMGTFKLSMLTYLDEQVENNESVLTVVEVGNIIGSNVGDLKAWFSAERDLDKKRFELVSFEDYDNELYWIITKFEGGKYVEVKRIKQ